MLRIVKRVREPTNRDTQTLFHQRQQRASK